MLGLVKERSASSSMTRSEDDLYLTTAQVYHLAIVQILDLPPVITHVIRNNGHVTCIQIDLWERTCATHMVTMGMGQHHRDRFGSNLCHNLVQLRYACPCINQKCTVITLDEVERLIIDPVSVPYPCMFVKLAEHHLIILINHFAAKVATVNFRSLRLSHIRHQAKQHYCNENISLHVYKCL